jgi:hypothetical protein
VIRNKTAAASVKRRKALEEAVDCRAQYTVNRYTE